MRSALPTAALLLILSACVHAPELVPAPATPTLPGRPEAAVAEGNGVRVILLPKWNGYPSDLGWVVTPVDVTVDNHSGHPLRIRYKEFSLKGGNGLVTAAIPPYRIQRPGTRTIVSPYYPGVGFAVAPPYAGFYPGYAPWVGPFDVDPDYYDYYSVWTAPLPTPEMLARAIPEGVLSDRGHVRGYLYFQRVPDAPVPFVFNAELVDAQTGAAFGKLSLPLVVQP